MGCLAKLRSSSWAYPTAVLSLYGFFANCRVAEPFLTPYLIGPNKNISGEVVSLAHKYSPVMKIYHGDVDLSMLMRPTALVF